MRVALSRRHGAYLPHARTATRAARSTPSSCRAHDKASEPGEIVIDLECGAVHPAQDSPDGRVLFIRHASAFCQSGRSDSDAALAWFARMIVQVDPRIIVRRCIAMQARMSGLPTRKRP